MVSIVLSDELAEMLTAGESSGLATIRIEIVQSAVLLARRLGTSVSVACDGDLLCSSSPGGEVTNHRSVRFGVTCSRFYPSAPAAGEP